MNETILYNFATKSRAEKFFRCLDNIREMSASNNYFVVAKIDTDDPADYSRAKDYREVFVKVGASNNKVHAINRDLDGLDIPEWDILCNHSDDMRFLVKGFDNVIRRNMDRDCFLHFPDGFVNERLSTYSMMDRWYYERFGYVYNPCYKNVYCDNEANDVAKVLCKYKFVNEKILSHDHPMWGMGQWDEQYKKTEEPVGYRIDGQIYRDRKANNFYL